MSSALPRLKGLKPARLLAHLLLLAAGLAYVFPFLWMLGGSLKTPGEFFSSGLNAFPQALQWQNYLDAWSKAKFGLYFGNTVFISVMTVIFTLLFSSMAGYALSRTQVPGKKFIIAAIVTTLFLPRGYTILPIVEIVRSLGLLKSLWGIVLVQVGGGLIFSTFLFMGYFSTMPKELEESAMMDGASFPRIYWSVMLPLAGPISATVTLFNFIGSWNDFFTPLVFSLGRPELRTLAVGMYAFQGENSREWTLICAGAVITILPIVILFLFLQRYFIEGISGAVKG